MNIAYLQCDMRYNDKLLAYVGEESVVQHTVKRIKNMECQKIVAGVYECEENVPLIKILETNGVQVVLSNDDNVNSRFVSLMKNEEADYVIRVGGDQVLCDVERTNEILKEMKKKGSDWFWDEASACVLPDIISKKCLMKYEEDILKENRYFKALEKKKLSTRYELAYPCILYYNFRVNSNEGFRICKKIIERQLNVYDLSKDLAVKLMNKSNYLNKTGILGSWIFPEEYFYDEEKKINPWLGRSVIDFIVPRLRKNFKVFEWGAGNSTLFWSQYVKEVVSVEYDSEWYEQMKKVIPSNVKLKFCELEYGGEYCKKVLEENYTFDIILIDGRDRVRCVYSAIERLSEDGIIIWDNSEREYYKEGYDFLRKLGFKRIELSSIIYGLPGVEDFTSIFYRDKNIFDI